MECVQLHSIYVPSMIFADETPTFDERLTLRIETNQCIPKCVVLCCSQYVNSCDERACRWRRQFVLHHGQTKYDCKFIMATYHEAWMS